MNRTEKLIEQLNGTKKIKNIRLAKSISKIHNGYIFGTKEGKSMEKNTKKANKLLIKMLPEEVRNRIAGIDQGMNAIIDYIERHTGWHYTKSGFYYRDNFHNMDDPEFRSFDTYCIPRDESGFHLDHTDKNKQLYIMTKEKAFYIVYSDMLRVLDDYIKEKDALISKSIPLTSDPELAQSLAIFLGYEEETPEEKTNRK